MFYELCPICLNSLVKHVIRYGDETDIWYKCCNKLCLSDYFLCYYKHSPAAQICLYSESFYCGSIQIRNSFKEKICYVYSTKHSATAIALPIYIRSTITKDMLESYLLLI